MHGDVISQHRDGQESFYHSDGQGSTLALTNAAGNVTDSYAYNAFGEVTEHTGDTVNPFQFIGQKGYYFDMNLNEYLVRQRPLLARLGIWLSVDPSVDSHELNGYLYVLNNPLNHTDSSGLAPDLKHEHIGKGGCNRKELDEIGAALKEACDFIQNPMNARCMPKTLLECLTSVCEGTVLTKCIKECDPEKGHHESCARAQVTKDRKEFSDPVGDVRCKSSVPKGATPVITFCLTIKGAPKRGAANLKSCEGKPEELMHLVFHELIHFCGAKHKIKDGRVVEQGDLIHGCMQSCLHVGGGDLGDCSCC